MALRARRVWALGKVPGEERWGAPAGWCPRPASMPVDAVSKEPTGPDPDPEPVEIPPNLARWFDAELGAQAVTASTTTTYRTRSEALR